MASLADVRLIFLGWRCVWLPMGSVTLANRFANSSLAHAHVLLAVLDKVVPVLGFQAPPC